MTLVRWEWEAPLDERSRFAITFRPQQLFMLQTHHRLFESCIVLCDAMLIAVAVWLGSNGVLEYLPWLPQSSVATGPEPLVLAVQALLLILAWLLGTSRLEFYRSRRTESILREFWSLVECWSLAFAIGTTLNLVLWGGLGYLPWLTYSLALLAIAGVRILVRSFLRELRDRGRNYRYSILIGRGRTARALAQDIQTHRHYGVHLLGSVGFKREGDRTLDGLADLGLVSQLREILTDKTPDSVIVSPSVQTLFGEVRQVIDLCDEAGIQFFYAPDFFTLRNLHACVSWFGDKPALTFQALPEKKVSLALKRAMDFAGALFGLLLGAPVMLAVALAIKIYDGGPVLFRQSRVGKGGKDFWCYKFRSMCLDAEERKAGLTGLNEAEGPVFKIRKDPRVTPVGRLIRKYSLDELPQLFNVLLGDMSLVGPRPPVPSEVVRYEWWQRRRISVRPGITCVWQVWGRNKVSFQRWVEMDLYYIDNWSLWLDVKLILHTFKSVLRGTGV